MIKVIDNFVTPKYHKEILDLMESQIFDWHLIKDISNKYADQQKFTPDSYGFFHMFYNDDKLSGWGDNHQSQYYQFLAPLFYQMMDASNTTKILRARGDMVTYKGGEPKQYTDHVDYLEPEYLKNKTAVYYVNGASGDTVIYKERIQDWKGNGKHTVDQIVKPKQNRVVIFDGDLIHNGGTPYKDAVRIISNCNFLE